MTAVLEYYPQTLTALLECIRILCQFNKPNWFLETCETPLETPWSVHFLPLTGGRKYFSPLVE